MDALQILKGVLDTQTRGQEIELVLTGHSLGGALAMLLAFDVAYQFGYVRHRPYGGRSFGSAEQMKENGRFDLSWNRRADEVCGNLAYKYNDQQFKLRCYTFGQPRVGDWTFCCGMDAILKDYWRIFNQGDPVADMPKHMILGSWKIPYCICGKSR